MKRLVVCCDGTWNTPQMACPTNVVKLAQVVRPIAQDGTVQKTHYIEGVGTKWLNKWTGGAFGWGLDDNIQAAYHFLGSHYEPGDEIYLFGFSRGAYTARSLGGLIYCSGLLRPPHLDHRQITAAYRLYRDDAIKPGHPTAVNFRQTYGDRVPITALCCWDTVGALGVPNVVPWLPLNQLINRKYEFHDKELSAIIQHALHAVAIDEIREPFQVTAMLPSRNSQATAQTVDQVWFPGDHGCVGGGTPAYQGLSDGALHWMIAQLQHLGLGLDLDRDRLDLTLQPTTNFNNQPRFPYTLTATLRRDVNNGFTALHHSVSQRWQQRPDYRPANLEPYRSQLDAYQMPSSS